MSEAVGILCVRERGAHDRRDAPGASCLSNGVESICFQNRRTRASAPARQTCRPLYIVMAEYCMAQRATGVPGGGVFAEAARRKPHLRAAVHAHYYRQRARKPPTQLALHSFEA